MRHVLVSIIVATVALAFTGCATNPVATASTADQKAFALYGEFVVFEELAAQTVVSPNTPAAVKTAIKQADEAAKPIADNLLAASRLVSSARVQLAAGKTTQAQVDILLTNLASWVAQATPLVANLVTAVKGSTGS